MEKIEWKPDYETGSEGTDNQHKRLVELFNRLHEGVEESHGEEEIGEYLKALEDYAAFHFDFEEAHLKKLPEEIYYSHKEEHDQFRTISRKIYAEIHDKHNKPALYELILYLEEWINQHIQFSDRFHMKNVIKERGQ